MFTPNFTVLRPGAALSALVGALFALAACATGLPVTTDVAPDYDFSAVRTYAFVSEEPLLARRSDAEISPLIEPAIRRSIDAQMAAKGYTKVPLAEADLSIAFTLGTRERIDVTPWGPYGRSWRRYYGWYDDPFYTDVDVYTEGVLAIDMFDARSYQPVWHGWTRSRLYGQRDVAGLVDPAVSAILGAFPSRGGGALAALAP
ncbi:MAG: DUF4136 domain-containing protein [Alphaproteobacteria bacterium]|nr:DUF4136 domain-containing protein [Alphaproteobacteria bacterium]